MSVAEESEEDDEVIGATRNAPEVGEREVDVGGAVADEAGAAEDAR